MKRRYSWLLAFMLASGAVAGDAIFAESFTQPMPKMNDAEREQFARGRGLIRQSWVIAPSKDREIAGLGPLYNRLACISCHPRNGRGKAPEDSEERMFSMLVRLSVPGENTHGGPKPHPAYGEQLNEEGIPGVPGEGRAFIQWKEVEKLILPGEEKVSLRRPEIEFRELAYGTLDDALSSLRVGQQMVGMGYLDAVSAETLESMANEKKPDGVKGRVNHVWNPETQRVETGRFGYKANVPSLRLQIASAFAGDLGLTSSIFPDENCTSVQAACKKAPSSGTPELSEKQLNETEFYLAHLELPVRRNVNAPEVLRGAAEFTRIGCATCHRQELETGKHPRFSRLSQQKIQPYTDLLIHDMGEGLSDGRPDFQADGREWRTPPLWGIGLTEAVSESHSYLHDGRARNLSEAILWHGGEAKIARDRFAGLPEKERKALLAFLNSL
ncbi:MAG: c-type cytochrome [Betaproteobacteria bacterium]|nr:c-type cytochrome [Betaproteobacteria bacterium]